MNRRLKAGIGVVLALGFLTAACSIGKVVTADATADPTCKCSRAPQSWDSRNNLKVQGDFVAPFYWGALESHLGIIVASLPSMRQLYQVLQDDYNAYVSRRSLIELSDTAEPSSPCRQGP